MPGLGFNHALASNPAGASRLAVVASRPSSAVALLRRMDAPGSSGMKRSFRAFIFEIAAAALLGAGALLLVLVYLPLINPGLFEFVPDESGHIHRVSLRELGERVRPLSYYLIGTPLALLLLAAAWWFNIKAFRARGET
jgi:hypothetical protein